MKYGDGITKQTQVKFGGYNHSLYARDGDIYDMGNITSKYYPLISQREKRATVSDVFDILVWEGTGHIWHDKKTIKFPSEKTISEVTDGVTVELTVVGEYKSNSGTYIVEDVDYNIGYTLIHFEDADFITNKSEKDSGNLTIKLIQKKCNIIAMGSGENVYFVTDSGSFVYDGEICGGELNTKTSKQFAETGSYIYILPDNMYFNKETKEIVKIKSISRGFWRMGSAIGKNFLSINAPSDYKNYFEVNDTVDVDIYYQPGKHFICTGAVIKDVYFYESDNTLDLDFTTDVFKEFVTSTGWDYSEQRNEIMRVTVTQGVPDLKHICAVNNRIWGCNDDTVFCTAFGQPLEWFEYTPSADGNDADVSFAVTPFDGFGEFTGCCVYDGVPMFFKENAVYKVYGDKASNFRLQLYEKPGVLKGAEKSIKIVGDSLFYLSPLGVMRFYGGTQKDMTTEFFQHFKNGVAGEDGNNYYISLTADGENYRLFVYNLKKGLWSVEDDLKIMNFIKHDNKLYALAEKENGNQILCLNPGNDLSSPFDSEKEMEKEDKFSSFIEFGDYYANSPDKKGVSKLFLRICIEKDSSVEVKINYDSEADTNGERVWQCVKKIETTAKKSFVLPMIPRRCDHFRLRIEGIGRFVLYSVSYEYYNGSSI